MVMFEYNFLLKSGLLILIISVFFSCTEIRHPEVIGFDSIELVNLSTNNFKVNGDIIFYNHNPFSLDLDKAEIDIQVDGISLGSVIQNYNTSMPSSSEFNMPVTIDLNLEKLYQNDATSAITRGLKIVRSKELEIFMDGYITVGRGSLEIRVPIEKTEKLAF